MKEVTRIHIAKVAYDSELEAKKALEKYLQTLEVYADDAELIDDIEIRITELLAERGVLRDGVLTMADVVAIKQQLGEPRDFMGEGDIAVGLEDLGAAEPARRYYRDLDAAVLGGVLSGIANFFNVNPLWLRLLAIFLLFISFGTAALAYCVLWLVVPPARTAAEKLRMSGRPVTLESIRMISEQAAINQPATEHRLRVLKRSLTIAAGVLCLMIAIPAAAITVGGVTAFGVQSGDYFSTDGYWVWAIMVGFGLSGLLLVTLAIMGAYAAFARKLKKRQIIAAVVVIILGLGSFGASLGMIAYQSWQRSDAIQRDTKEVVTKLPAEFKNVQTVKIDAPNVTTRYEVSDTPRLTLTSLPAFEASYSLDGTSATISVKDSRAAGQRNQSSALLTIYGPALTQLDIIGGQVSYQAQAQDMLLVHILPGASEASANEPLVRISGGTIGTLSITSDDTQSIVMSAEDASVRVVKAVLRSGDALQLGKIESLDVTYPDVCPASGQLTTVTLSALQSATMMVNQKSVPSRSLTTPCGTVAFNQVDEGVNN